MTAPAPFRRFPVPARPGLAGLLALAAAQPEQTAQAEQIVRLAHQTCPFSNAMRGNVVTRLLLNGAPLDETA